jgi:hypothetical protein
MFVEDFIGQTPEGEELGAKQKNFLAASTAGSPGGWNTPVGSIEADH